MVKLSGIILTLILLFIGFSYFTPAVDLQAASSNSGNSSAGSVETAPVAQTEMAVVDVPQAAEPVPVAQLETAMVRAPQPEESDVAANVTVANNFAHVDAIGTTPAALEVPAADLVAQNDEQESPPSDSGAPTALQTKYTGPATIGAARDALRGHDFATAAAVLSSPELTDNAEAQYLLSTLYRNGDGVERDDARAFNLAKQSADKGYVDAEFSLGRMYLSGRGVEQDPEQARHWMARAAEAGHVGATEALVVLMTQPLAAPAEVPQQQVATVQVQSSDIGQRLGRSPMMEAAERGETRTVLRLLAAGEPVDTRDAAGQTPLMLAAATAHPDTLDALLEAGAHVDANDADRRTAIMFAAESGNAPVLERLVTAGARLDLRDNSGHSATDIALLSGHCDFALMLASRLPPAEMAEMPEDSISAALATCNATEMDSLASAGLSLDFTDQRGRNAIWYAANAGNAEVVNYLIKRGYSPDSADTNGVSPLLIAINAAQEPVAMPLIAAGANVEATTTAGNTPLLIAATRGLPDVTEALIHAGAQVNHRNRDGFSALMLAAKYGRKDIAEMLIASGADTGLRNVKRERAADIASAAGYEEIASLMR